MDGSTRRREKPVGQARQQEGNDGSATMAASVPVDRASHILCSKCQGSAGRAARTRSVTRVDEDVHYLAYLWRCSICGHEWEDEALRGLNAAAAEEARSRATSP
jgi:hypothetical protein